ncbi:DnaJ C-terminal domain-containing protein [Hyphomicrobium sp.]|uniref:DnaJ C-terminal domain-containing protein n=1 Tax=Hyphomicrobium sp. TaxID=82 RepID=UPI002E31373A|nr:DnaJ C-terminal domain-containing protein [Hyphomicrobium sp.]HEX2842012.1 DnaJ C-terminal domain-containing protein [Hyphomicrobium sp.]
MADDPYEILGVPRGATDEQIRRAYLKLVKELHPDVNPSKTAEERFKKVTAAHDILGDTDRRRQFDAGEIDASGEPRRPAWRSQGAGAAGRGRGGPIFEDFGDVFSDLFSGGGRAGGARSGFSTRGRDVRYTLDVDFLEAVQGAKKRVTLPDAGVLDLNVPEGVSDGQVLRLRGRGEAGSAGGEAGDALVEIRVRPHRDFRREGDDILVDLPITIDEAVLGGKVEVPTASGRVQLTIPKGTSSGQVLRLKGKGVRNATTGATGDELVTIKIVLPDAIDEGLSYFLSEWRQKHRYDPRK